MGNLCAKETIDFSKEVDITHFEVWRILGKGAFGKVHIVQHKKSKIEYAIKYINKERCIKQKMTVHVIRERNLLEELESPFITNLRYAFQDDVNLLMVVDLKLGGDLRFHLKQEKSLTFKEPRAKFYVVEVALGLQYLHSMKIIHRDIKPENVLLDNEGHSAITDFNVACKYDPEVGRVLSKVDKGTNKILTSMVGTPFYMAPEMVAKKLYDESVDFWSLGVMLYEFVSGHTPFDDGRNTHLFDHILSEKISYSKKLKVSHECQKIMGALLEKSPKKRLGHSEKGGFEELKKHDWFKDIDWELAAGKNLPVPFVPNIKAANCDPDLILDDVFLNENKLGEKPVINEKENGKNLNVSAKKGGKLSSRETQLKFMKENYKTFDFSKVLIVSKPGRLSRSSTGSSRKISLASANMGLGDDDIKPFGSTNNIALNEADEANINQSGIAITKTPYEEETNVSEDKFLENDKEKEAPKGNEIAVGNQANLTQSDVEDASNRPGSNVQGNIIATQEISIGVNTSMQDQNVTAKNQDINIDQELGKLKTTKSRNDSLMTNSPTQEISKDTDISIHDQDYNAAINQGINIEASERMYIDGNQHPTNDSIETNMAQSKNENDNKLGDFSQVNDKSTRKFSTVDVSMKSQIFDEKKDGDNDQVSGITSHKENQDPSQDEGLDLLSKLQTEVNAPTKHLNTGNDKVTLEDHTEGFQKSDSTVVDLLTTSTINP